MTRFKFLLIDQDRYRAGAISAALIRHRGVTVVSEFSELADGSPGHSIVFAADEPGTVAHTIAHLKKAGVQARVIAYAEHPTSHGMVKAMSEGAVDYLQWPCDGASILAAANAAIAGAIG